MTRRLVVLAAFAISLVAAPSALAANSDLSVAVSGSPDPVAAGQYVSYEISVTNNGPDSASNVIVTAPLPAHTQYVQNASNCSLAAATITCTVGTLPNTGNRVFEVVLRLTNFSFHGTFNHTYTVSSSSTDPNAANDTATDIAHVRNDSHDHHVTVSKVEKQFDLEAGQFKTETLTCPNGGSVVDGSVRIDNVDQGTGNLRSVGVVESKSVGNDWEFSARNYATGRAQGKVFGVCLPHDTENGNDAGGPSHKHAITFEPLQTVSVVAPTAGHYDVVIHCNAPLGTFVSPAAPGYEFTAGGAGELVRSEEDLTAGPGWSFGFEMSAPGTINVSLRCLDRYVGTTLGHTHELWLSHPDIYVTVPPNYPAGGQFDIDCSDEAKGIVATYDLPFGVWMVGNDPQPKRRSFKLVNETAVDQTVHLDLLCIGDRTGTDPPPPAPPAAVKSKTKAARNGRTLPVRFVCPAGGCSGTVILRTRAVGSPRRRGRPSRVIGRRASHPTTPARARSASRSPSATARRSGGARSAVSPRSCATTTATWPGV